jgi:protein TonB
MAAAALVLAGHVGLGLALHRAPPLPPAPQAPEAAIFIDLPPELALPPAESVESVASAPAPEVEPAEPAEVPPLKSATRDVPEAVSPPSPAEVAAVTAPDTATTSPDISDVVPSPATEPPPPVAEVPPEPIGSVPDPAPGSVAEAAFDAAEAVEEVAPKRPVEVATAHYPVPPDVRPRAKPRPEAPKPKAVAKSAAPKPRTESPRPPAAASTATASAASGAGRPDPDALAGYSAAVRKKIMRHRADVGAGVRKNQKVTVSFTVSAGGGISGVRIVQSSGNRALDDAAVTMVRRAVPLPAIPPEIGRTSLRLSLPVRFDG